MYYNYYRSIWKSYMLQCKTRRLTQTTSLCSHGNHNITRRQNCAHGCTPALGAGTDPPFCPINHVPISITAEQCLYIQKPGVSILILRDKFHCLLASHFLWNDLSQIFRLKITSIIHIYHINFILKNLKPYLQYFSTWLVYLCDYC